MPVILLVGRDLRLLATRAAVLAQLGSIVKWGLPTVIEHALEKERVDVLVLCHTLSMAKREELTAKAREQDPRTEVLQLVSTIEIREIALMPGVKVGVCDPVHLLGQVKDLLEESARQRHSSVRGPEAMVDGSYQFKGPEVMKMQDTFRPAIL